MSVVPVLLAGGIGSRLWPMSTASRPKQLQALIGSHTMIQETMVRLDGLALDAPIVVCNAEHAAAIRDDLGAIGANPQTIIAEPVGRSTAPAVAAAALLTPPESVLLILPADHLIGSPEPFRVAVQQAVEAAAEGGIVTFGVVPTRAETGFGYIRPSVGPCAVSAVESFFEKPDSDTARRYVDDGYLWNSGMFAFRADVILEELRRLEPDLVGTVEEALAGAGPGGIVHPGPGFADAPTLSIDHAVMERTRKAMVVPLDAGWSDVGSWASLYQAGAKDGWGNVIDGDVVSIGVTGSYLRSTARTVAVIGVSGVVVVETPDAVLVVAIDRAQDVKAVVEELAGRIGPA
jgi:mannose-1-phosphate guanylyltransferase / mannose-6-phosphate isomerase